jgi:hypothetical protein
MDRGAEGSKGGRATFERYGRKPMQEIGARGFATTVARHWQGDRKGCRDYLGFRRHEAHIEAFVDRELARRLENGEEVACVEMPVLAGPDDGVPFSPQGEPPIPHFGGMGRLERPQEVKMT